MALNRREAAIAGVGIFIAWGFATHWLPVLQYLGYSFLAGIVLAILVVASLGLLSSRKKKSVYRKSNGNPQTVAFISSGTWGKEIAWLSGKKLYSREPLYPSSYIISDGIDGLLELILGDFVTSWYHNITGSPTFSNEIEKAIRIALCTLRERIENVDIVELAVSRFFPILTSHLKEFYEAEHTVRGKNLNRNITESEELDLAIAAKYKDGKLHKAASLIFSDTKLVQQEYLRKLVVRLLPELLSDSMIKSKVVSVLIKEIVSCAVLAPVLQMLADPDTWNQLMEAYVWLAMSSAIPSF